jgi:hypothetical protein
MQQGGQVLVVERLDIPINDRMVDNLPPALGRPDCAGAEGVSHMTADSAPIPITVSQLNAPETT